MPQLKEDVKLRSRLDSFYTWTEGRLLKPSNPRAYDEIYNLIGRNAS